MTIDEKIANTTDGVYLAQRMLQHRKRFRLHTRSAKQSQAQLHHLEQDWITLPPDRS
jgi:hypothetical protein